MIDIYIPTIREDISKVLTSISKATRTQYTIQIIREGNSYAEAINTRYILMQASRNDDDIFFCGADDIIFYDDWDIEALKIGGDVIGTNDLHHPGVINGDHATHYLVRYGYIRKYGGTLDNSAPVIYPYLHNYTDTEFIETAKFRKCFKPAPKSIVEHLHPCFGLAKTDAGYEKSANTIERDRITFEKRQHLWQ